MKKLRMNVSQMNGARSSLKSTASTFSSQIKNQDLFSKYNCNEASVSSIIKNYISICIIINNTPKLLDFVVKNFFENFSS